MQKGVEERLALEADLKQALRNGELEMHYQPQVTAERKILGAEILLRWRHPVRGFVLPGDFIAVAEETGDIIEIGNWIVRMACTKLQEWQEQPNKAELALSINVSSRQFREPGFAQLVGQAVKESGINPARLKLELTESLMLDSIEETSKRMEELKKIGVTFSLDDFGTGYSSLIYLKQLPLSQLKIDHSFVHDITTDKNDAILIRTIVGMAENLNLQVIAEGVETEEQLAALYEMGCRMYQGYYFSRPVPLADFEKMIV
jgi:EAL domain-containing protein (putative c-di-GMP-specific phosphodiesterase class I)